MLPEDFSLLIPLEAPSTRIPACYYAINIEHVDSVVGYRLDQQTISPIFSQRRGVAVGRFLIVETFHLDSLPPPQQVAIHTISLMATPLVPAKSDSLVIAHEHPIANIRGAVTYQRVGRSRRSAPRRARSRISA